jgi:(d)CTP diphosphatase
MSDVERIRVVAAVIERDGCLLVAQRPANKRHGNLWEFPGGKVEPLETTLDAIRRELDEELGVEVIAVGEVVRAYADTGSPYVIEFTATRISGTPTAHEHQQLAWVTPAELIELNLAPSDRRFADAYAKGEITLWI